MSFVWTDRMVRVALGLREELAVEGVEYTAVCTDSRSVRDGALYVALVGENFDGHDFVAAALSEGAIGAVVSGPVAGAGVAPIYPVDDTLVSLGALARYRRDALQVPVVGITGSSGKTTTKDLMQAALSRTLTVHATKGNLNNRIGAPMTILSTPDDAEVVVVEMGTNEPGEIGALAHIGRPDIGVLTTVGESHLEKLGSVEGVLHEKLDLIRGLAQGGRAVVGDTPPMLVEGAREVLESVRVAGWSERADEDLRPEDARVDGAGRWSFGWHGHRAGLRLPGRHAVANALLALAVAEMLGVPRSDAAAGLSDAEPGDMRGHLQSIGDVRLLVDCYNANPQSVRAALDLLGTLDAGRRVAVLGTMLELGVESDQLHEDVLEDALAGGLDLIVATGDFVDAAERRGWVGRDDLIAARDWHDAYAGLRQRMDGSETVLLKASRGVALEGMVDLFENDFGGRASAGQES